MSPERLFTITELAEHVGRCEKFIRKAIEHGLAHHQQVAGGKIYITLDQWKAYLDQTLVTPGASSGPSERTSARKRSRGSRSPRTIKTRRDPTGYAEIDF